MENLKETLPPLENLSKSKSTKTQTELWLDIRPHFHYYEAPSLETIHQSLKKVFKRDEKLVIRKFYGPSVGIFKIFSWSEPTKMSISFQRKDNEGGVMEEIQVPISTTGPNLIITIVNADMDKARSISNEDFDAAFSKYGEVVVSTRSQRYKSSTIFTGNRFVVIDNRENKQIPDRLWIQEHSFLLKYKGKKWLCSSCMELHMGPCPYLAEFYAKQWQKIYMAANS